MSEVIIERDWTTKAGLRAICLLIPGRHRCGYVGVPPGHLLHGRNYTDVVEDLPDLPGDTPLGKRGIFSLMTAAHGGGVKRLDVYFDVHGSLTYAGGHGQYPVPSDLWWFGFDCAHAGDGTLDRIQFSDEPVRSESYVVSECESLAAQIAAAVPSTGEAA